MSNLLLEFNKKDLEEVLKDENIFTIAYEIELEADDPGAYTDGGSRIDLSEVIPAEHIWEKASEIFYQKSPEGFYDYISAPESNIGRLYVEWLYDEHSHAGIDWVIFQTANSLGLLDETIDQYTLEHMGDILLNDAYYQLLRGDEDAWRVFAKMAMSNGNLKQYLENNLDISVTDINQLDMFGEESKLKAVTSLLKQKIPKERRKQFFGNLFVPAHRDKQIPYQISMKDFMRELAPYTDLGNEDGSEETEEMNQIFRMFYEMDFQQAIEDIVVEINRQDSGARSLDDFSSFDIEAEIPDEYYSEIERWVNEKFTSFREEKTQEIVEEISYNLNDHFEADDYLDEFNGKYDENDIENAVARNFPNFYRKWGSDLEFTFDGSLTNGFEMFPSSYISTLEEGLEFLRDFYEDFNSQSTFEFSRSTGLHTNIGVENFSGEWNYFKGFLFTNDNFATRGFSDRLYNNFSKSLKKTIMSYVDSGHSTSKRDFRAAVEAVVEANFDKVEKLMNEVIEYHSDKSHGFSIRPGRIEFRYPGGDLYLDDMEAATLYYAYIVKLCTDPAFKRKEYVRKAVAFMLGLSERLEQSDYAAFGFEDGKEINFSRGMQKMKKAFLDNPNPNPIFKIKSNILKEVYAKDLGIFLEPGVVLSDPSAMESFNTPYRGGYPIYFQIDGHNEKSKIAQLTVFSYDSADFIASAEPKQYWMNAIQIYGMKITEHKVHISLYNLIGAFDKGLIEPVDTEDYAKIMIFKDTTKVDKLLMRIYPWMSELMKAIKIKGQNHFTKEEVEHIENGTFEQFYNQPEDRVVARGEY